MYKNVSAKASIALKCIEFYPFVCRLHVSYSAAPCSPFFRVNFGKLAESQGLDGIRVDNSADLRPALKRGIAATREGTPFLVDVRVSRTGGGAESTWHQAFNLADTRTRKR